jgi:ubiquitin conjugation factor E4 B
MAPSADAPRIEWQSLLGPLARLSVYPREFVSSGVVSLLSSQSTDRQAEIWKTYFSNPTERNVKDIDANKDNLRHTLNGLQVRRQKARQC